MSDFIGRLVEHYEGWRYRRTYGRNADHSRALAAADAQRACAANPRTDGQPWEPWEGNGPCQDCGRRNVLWVAPNHVWNRVMGQCAPGLLCPICFAIRAHSAGLQVVWQFAPEDNDAYWHARADERERLRIEGVLTGAESEGEAVDAD